MSKEIFQKIFKVKRRPFSAWQIELTTRCPLKCRMCIRKGFKDWHGSDMDMDNFKKLTPYFKDVESVVLSGWGEPLLHRNLIESIRLVKESGAQTGFVTSGKGLSAEYIPELINAGTDFIGFSLAGAAQRTHNYIRTNSDLKTLLNNIQIFTVIKKSKKLKKPNLHIVYLMLKDNIFEVPSLIELARDIGIHTVILINLIHITNNWQEKQRVFSCDPPISPLNLPLVRGEFKGGVSTYEEILKEAEVKAKELKINLRRPSLSPIQVPVCEENPLKNIYVSVDGNVSPCVYLYPPTSSPFKRIFCSAEHQVEKLNFGNIFNEPFHAIWNNKRYSEFRGCFMHRTRNFEKMFFYFGDRESIKKLTTEPLPNPPEQCKTCHKMLGV